MPKPRTDLQLVLESILGNRNVYYNPPASVKIKYPAVVYERSDIETLDANNDTYIRYHRYMLTLIDKNVDSVYVDAIIDLPFCSYDRHYVADNLHHDVFSIYF